MSVKTQATAVRFKSLDLTYWKTQEMDDWEALEDSRHHEALMVG